MSTVSALGSLQAPPKGCTVWAGLETEANTGHVSYDAANHQQMIRERAKKVQGGDALLWALER